MEGSWAGHCRGWASRRKRGKSEGEAEQAVGWAEMGISRASPSFYLFPSPLLYSICFSILFSLPSFT